MYCLFRADEILGIRWAHLAFDLVHERATLHLPSTKTFVRTGNAEVVTVYDAWLVKLLRAVSARHGREQNLLPMTYHQLRNAMAQLVKPAGLPPGRWLTHSIRRGGATAYFKATASYDRTAERGRWQCIRTCRTYVNEAMALATYVRSSQSQRRRMAVCHSALQDWIRSVERSGPDRR